MKYYDSDPGEGTLIYSFKSHVKRCTGSRAQRSAQKHCPRPQKKEIARGLLERIIALGTRAIPELQGSSKKAHVEPSSSQNKLWTPKTTSAARKSTVLGRKEGNSARSSGENHYPRNARNPRAPRLIKKGPCGAEQQPKQAVDAQNN